MSVLEIILSSAVIVGFIDMIIHNKSNKLQYITAERSKWREELKQCALQLEECKSYDKKCKKIFAKLKANLNSYGYCADGEYPEDRKLNLMQDQHIWKAMYLIEQGIVEFYEGKKHMQEYLSLLLKFDWERSKEEADVDGSLIISIVSYGLIILISIVFRIDAFDEGEFVMELDAIMSVLMALSLPFLCLWGTRFLDSVKNFRDNKWYKKTFAWLVSWLAGVFIFVGVYLGCLSKMENKIMWCGGWVLFIIAFILMADSTADYKRRYIRYENAIISIETEIPCNLYLYSEQIRELLVEDKFQNLNLLVEWRYLKYKRDWVETLLEEIVGLDKQLNWESYIRWGYKIKFERINRREQKISWENYILAHPKCLKPILRYEDNLYIGYINMLKAKIE